MFVYDDIEIRYVKIYSEGDHVKVMNSLILILEENS